MTNRTREEARQDKGEEEQLKGSFYSVLLIGAFILAAWLTVFGLYLARQ